MPELVLYGIRLLANQFLGTVLDIDIGPVCVEGRLVHLDVEVRSEELLAPALLCHKEPARASKAP